MLQLLKKVVPEAVRRRWAERRVEAAFERLPTTACAVEPLARLADVDLNAIFNAPNSNEEWPSVSREIEDLAIANGVHGVNAGDRRAIYYLVRALDPASVLEVGTHIGTSLVHIVSALKRGSHADFEIETVDIWDVNDPAKRRWQSFGATHSPREMVRRLGCADRVEFFAQDSIEYLKTCDRKFDFIFLDGEHAAAQVYQELPASLKVLNDGGYILMHDVFPDMKPLWSNGRVIRGPFQAIERLRSEGCQVGVRPLGALPWPTKLRSNVTSLALLGRP